MDTLYQFFHITSSLLQYVAAVSVANTYIIIWQANNNNNRENQTLPKLKTGKLNITAVTI